LSPATNQEILDLCCHISSSLWFSSTIMSVIFISLRVGLVRDGSDWGSSNFSLSRRSSNLTWPKVVLPHQSSFLVTAARFRCNSCTVFACSSSYHALDSHEVKFSCDSQITSYLNNFFPLRLHRPSSWRHRSKMGRDPRLPSTCSLQMQEGIMSSTPG
jgi:hypothetical protein